MKSDPSVTSAAINKSSGNTIASSSNCVPRSDLLLLSIVFIAHHRPRTDVQRSKREVNELIGCRDRHLRVLQSSRTIHCGTVSSAGAVLQHDNVSVRNADVVPAQEVLHVRHDLRGWIG